MPVDNHDLHREFGLCQERLLQIEHEIELHGWSLVDRLSREYARLEWLCRLLSWQSLDARDLESGD